MKYNELQASSTPDRKRVGRGISAGQGKTAGRGTKGQGARTGKKLNAMFQGGQRPLAKAVPKARGFKSLRSPAQVVYLDNLNIFAGKNVDNALLFESGLIGSPNQAVKVINRGKLTTKVVLQVDGASKSVIKAVTDAGGSFIHTAVPLNKTVKIK
jgi:large subunit ribosomal protein L15